MEKMVKISQEKIDAAYAEATGAVKQVLDRLFKDTRPVTERIKTFKDALEELGEDHPLVVEFRQVYNDAAADTVIYIKLKIITAALNEGWEPTFKLGEETRYYPWVVRYSESEYKKLPKSRQYGAVAHRSGNGAGADGGVGCLYVASVDSWVYAYIGSRLLFKSKELAEYAAKQFLDLYIKYSMGTDYELVR